MQQLTLERNGRPADGAVVLDPGLRLLFAGHDRRHHHVHRRGMHHHLRHWILGGLRLRSGIFPPVLQLSRQRSKFVQPGSLRPLLFVFDLLQLGHGEADEVSERGRPTYFLTELFGIEFSCLQSSSRRRRRLLALLAEGEKCVEETLFCGSKSVFDVESRLILALLIVSSLKMGRRVEDPSESK